MNSDALQDKSNRSRVNALISIYHAESGHPGGILSAMDLLTTLFEDEMSFTRGQALRTGDDRFILSKGHAVPALYAVAAEVGLLDPSQLKTLRKLGSPLQGHPHRGATPWLNASTGSLGQGFSFAVGEALGYKMQGRDNRVYVMLGDGELQEGEVWEGAMFAGHHGISNLCAIIDYNKMQSDDLNENIMTLEPLADKWRAFNWHVVEIDGHDFPQIKSAFKKARAEKQRPTLIIAHTIKGKGVSYMEGSPAWHGSLQLSDEDLQQALSDLGVEESEMEGLING